MKGDSKKKAEPQNSQQQTLVIKTKSFSDAVSGAKPVPRSKGDEPEYELTKILGEGGMGIVYDARQTSIDRNVAVKMLKAKSAQNQKQRAKFLAEAVVTGELDHPNIVPIYDVGSNAEGALFYSMKKVQGTPWLKAIKQKTLPENLEILMKIADAVGFAHARGVVHRDLKPENVMLGEFGEVLVMDWGLAQPSKHFRKSRSITETNTMGGTPAYMAPEMTTGPIEKIGPASDVYLLGAMLFEILTGGPPHVAKNAMKCLMAAARNEIAPTDKKGELMDIAMRAMATNPADRFQDVKSFQGAIRDYQSHSESVLLSQHAQLDLQKAKDSRNYENFSRAVFGFQQAIELWSGNKGAVTGLADAKLSYAQCAFKKGDLDLSLSLLDVNNPDHGGLRTELLEAQRERDAKHRRLELLKRLAIGLAAAVFVIVGGASIWIRHEQLIAIEQRDNAEAQKERAVSAEKLAVSERDNARQAARKEAIAKLEAEKNEKEAKRQEAEAKKQQQLAEIAKEGEEYEAYISKIGLAASQIDKNAFDAARSVLNGCKSELRNWEWRRLVFLCDQSGFTDAVAEVDALAIDHEGKRFATGGWNGMARIWDRTSHQLLWELKHDCDYVHAVAFSPDGQYLATGSSKPGAYLQLWDCETGERVRSFKGHDDGVLSVAFSRDGTRLLTGSYDKSARLWEVTSGKELNKFEGQASWVWSAVFSPDETRIVTAGQDGTARIYEISGKPFKTPFVGHKGPVYAATFSPDGNYVVTAGFDRRILIWVPEEIRANQFQKLTDKANPNSIRDARIIPEANYRALEGHSDAIRSIRFSPDGTRLVSGSQDNTIRVWDFVTGNSVSTFRGHGRAVTAAMFLPDEKHLLSASHDRSVREWDIETYQEQRTLTDRSLNGHSDAVLAASYSPKDQNHIVTASRDRSARTWNALTGMTELELKEGHEYLASSAVFFPDGLRLVTAAVDNTTRIWDVTTGGETRSFKETGRTAAVAVSRNKLWFATGGSRTEETGQAWNAQLWNAETGERIRVFPDHVAEVNAVAISPDDRLLATGDLNGHVRLWNIETGELVSKLEGHQGKISAIRFLKSGTRLMTASIDKTVGHWDVATGKEIPSLILKHPDSVISMEVIPGTDQLMTTCADRLIRQWDASQGTLIQTIRSFEYVVHHPTDIRFVGPTDSDFHSISISADGQRLIVADSIRRTVHMWDLTANREVPGTSKSGQLGPWITLNQNMPLWSTAFYPVNDDILTVGGNTARLWDMKSKREIKRFSQNDTIASAKYSPDEQWIATGSWDFSAKIWDVKTGRVKHKLESGLTGAGTGHRGNVNSTVFSRDSRRLLTASDDGTAKVWDFQAEKLLMTLKGHTDRVRSATYSPDGTMIATASDDKTVRLWDSATGAFIREFRGHLWGVICVEFSPDSTLLITGSNDAKARIWDVKTAESKHELSGHTAMVTSVAISPDGRRILTGSSDHTAKLWDSDTGKEILTLSRHSEDVTSVAFSPDGREVLTASRDGSAVIWLSKDQLAQPVALTKMVKSPYRRP